MSQVYFPDVQVSRLQLQADKVILITCGSQGAKHAEDLREAMLHSGFDSEIVWGDVSDPNQIRKLIHDVLDGFHLIDAPVNHAEIQRDLAVGKMTDEEWLAQ